MVMRYANKYFLEFMEWLYIRYRQITPRDLRQNQDNSESTYNIKNLIKILFDQMEIGQGFTIAGNTPFSDRNLADMGVNKIPMTRKYKHVYHI